MSGANSRSSTIRRKKALAIAGNSRNISNCELMKKDPLELTKPPTPLNDVELEVLFSIVFCQCFSDYSLFQAAFPLTSL